jgi:biotin operon repressor
MALSAPTDLSKYKGRNMADETSESEQQINREKYALLKEFHRTLRQALTGAEYKVFCALEDWSESKGECWHSQSTIADACDISLRSVNAAIKQLETLGLIETKEHNGQSSTYIPAKPTYAKIAYLRDNLRKNCTGGYAKSAQPPTQNLHINVSNLNGSNINELTTPNGVAAPPQKSRTIDLSDYPAKEPQPEEQLPMPSYPDTLECHY